MRDPNERPYQYNSTLRSAAKPMRKVSDRKRRERGMPGTAKYGAHHVYVRDNFDCVLVDHPEHRCWTPVDPREGDAANCVPACRKAHGGFHDLACDNDRILARWHVDLKAIASDIWARSPHGPGRAS